jgi:membrane protease YdiL (CAAX protease family)
MDIRAATAWEVGLFLVPFAIVIGVMWVWMRRQGRTLADLGWRRPSTWTALILGVLLGLGWGAMGAFSYLHFNPEADLAEVSQLRLFTALAGGLIAVMEDLVTRGFLMEELKRIGSPTWMQVLASALLFALYHSVWGFSIPGFVFSLVYGLLLCGLFVLGKRSLTPVILGHSLALIVGEPFLTLSLMESIQMATGG